MADPKRLRAIDPGAPYQQLAMAEETPPPGPAAALYRFYDSGRRLLYVGITGQPRERWTRHRRNASWWTAVAYVAVEIFPAEWEALDAERAAIRSESPRFNKRSRRSN